MMNKKMLTWIIVLGVVFLVLAVTLAILLPRFQLALEDTTTSTASTTPQPEDLGRDEPEKLLRIELDETDFEDYGIYRDSTEDSWKLIGQEAVTLDQSLVGTMVSALSEGVVASDVAGADFSNLAQYGLENPKVTLTLTYEGGETEIIHIGNTLMAGSRCYAYKEGTQRMVLLSSTYYTYATNEPYHYATVKSFYVDGPNVQTLRILKDGVSVLKLIKVGEDSMSLGEYIITEPYQVLATDDIGDFTDKLSAITLLGTVDVTNDNLAKYGLDKPAYTIEVAYDPYYISGTGDFTMYVGGQSQIGSYYVCFEGEEGVYTVPEDQMEFATGLVTYQLVNRMYMLYSIKTMDSFQVETPAEGAHSVKIIQPPEGSDGTVKATYELDGKAANQAAGIKMYLALLSLSSHGEIPTDFTPGPTPDFSVTLTFASDTHLLPGVYSFYKYEHDYYAVCVDGLPQFYTRSEKVTDFLTAYQEFLAAE